MRKRGRLRGEWGARAGPHRPWWPRSRPRLWQSGVGTTGQYGGEDRQQVMRETMAFGMVGPQVRAGGIHPTPRTPTRATSSRGRPKRRDQGILVSRHCAVESRRHVHSDSGPAEAPGRSLAGARPTPPLTRYPRNPESPLSAKGHPRPPPAWGWPRRLPTPTVVPGGRPLTPQRSRRHSICQWHLAGHRIALLSVAPRRAARPIMNSRKFPFHSQKQSLSAKIFVIYNFKESKSVEWIVVTLHEQYSSTWTMWVQASKCTSNRVSQMPSNVFFLQDVFCMLSATSAYPPRPPSTPGET